MQKNIPNLYALIDMNNPDAIMAEVRSIALTIAPQVDFAPIDSAYQDVLPVVCRLLTRLSGLQ
jgi:hypothetical protein